MRKKTRQLIEIERGKLVEVLPDAVQNVKDLVAKIKDIPEDDIKQRELSYKATKDVLKATNVFPAPQYAQTIYNDNRKQNTVISESVLKMFQSHAADLVGDDEGCMGS